jgi:hypothetical protein
MKMSLKKQMLGDTVQLLTKKIIYVRRVRPKAMGLCLWRNSGGSGRHHNSEVRGMTPGLLLAPSLSALQSFFLMVIGLEMAAFTPLVQAEHEVDHRFIVEGYVCAEDGRSMANQEVMVKDTRIPLGKTTYTDSDGFYTVTLHLHNENQGDPILVAAGDREQRITAKFDPKDMKVERKMVVNIGAGCEGAHSGSKQWVYYSVGLGLAGVAAFAGARMIRKQRRPVKRGKAQRK